MTEKGDLLISYDQITRKIAEIAREIDAEYMGEDLTIVMVMKGALCLTADLIRHLNTPTTLEYIKASSYGHRGKDRGDLEVFGLEDLNLELKNVLIVDDIFDSGQTLSQIVVKLREKGPKSLKTLVLLSKKVERETKYVPDHVLFDIDDLFVIGFGLDYKEHYRGLPGIYAIKVNNNLSC